MSASPNQMITSSSPPSSVAANDAIMTKVVVPMPVIQQHDEIYYYVFVKGSLYSPDSCVFGLEVQEIQALAKKFNSPCKEVENGIMFKKSVCETINALAQLGYKVISTCGEGETLFTLQREI
jgi:hypothetical protein